MCNRVFFAGDACFFLKQKLQWNLGRLLACPLAGMGDQHQVHVWENTYIMQPKDSIVKIVIYVLLAEAPESRR